MLNRTSKPKKVFLNYNLIKKDYQTESYQSTNTRNHSISFNIKPNQQGLQNNTEVYEEHKQVQGNQIAEHCYLFYIDNMDTKGLQMYCLKFKLADKFISLMRSEIVPMFDQALYDTFKPYADLTDGLSSVIQPKYMLQIYSKIKTKDDLLDYFWKLKFNGQEDNIKLMFEYYFVPSKLLADQTMKEIKKQLELTLNQPNNQINIIADLNGQTITNIYQIGWNPTTLLCASSDYIIQSRRELVINKINIARQLKQLIQFKDKICSQYSQIDGTYKPNHNIQQLVQARLTLQENTIISQIKAANINNSFNLPKLKHHSTNNKDIFSYNIHKDSLVNKQNELKLQNAKSHMSIEEIKSIQLIYPKITVLALYTYFIDYKSLLLIQPIQEGIQISPLIQFCFTLQYHSNTEIKQLLVALNMSPNAYMIKWEAFLTIRILMDNLGTQEQNISFVYQYFKTNNGIKDEASIILTLEEISSRIEKLATQQKDHAIQLYREMDNIQNINVKLNVPNNKVRRLHNTFKDKFTLTLYNWMEQTGQIQDKQLNQAQMLSEYPRSEYMFIFLINCILGKYTSNVLEWFYNIY